MCTKTIVLKITVSESAEELRIRLEGKLTSPWVSELEHCWRDLRQRAGRQLVVDLSEVDHADDAGRYLLAWMHECGVRLHAPSLALQQMAADIGRSASRLLGLLLALVLLGGAVPSVAQPLKLTLRRAVELALSPEGNARIEIAQEAVRQAESRAAQARAALLPDIEGSVGQTNQTRNLAAVGIQIESPIPGLQIPTFVGPFNTFDVRGVVRQNVFDLALVRRWRSSRISVDATRAQRGHTSDEIAAQVVRAWLAALKADADVDTARANVELADALAELVENQKRAGTGTGIEVTRAKVQRANERQRLLAATNDRRRARLQLLRAIGLRLDTDLELDGSLALVPTEPAEEGTARTIAFERRSDYQAQLRREDAAQASASAAALERLPSIAGFADYGSIGTSVNNALPTRAFGLSVRVPVFDGGRRDARRAEGSSLLRQERARTRDLREAIELEIRVALDTLASSAEQVEVAKEGLNLADDELASARRRYTAGVATSIEVTDAQTRVQRARDNHAAALFSHNLARVDLAQAQGTIEDLVR